MAKISFRQLEVFDTISGSRSFRAAARKLGVTQSSVSRHMQELEDSLATPLLDRRGREARLTLAGLEVIDQARDILRLRDEIARSLRGQEAPVVRTLRVGLTELTALTWLPLFVERVRSAFPAIKLHISMEQGLTLLQRLNVGELDLIILPDVFKSANVLSTSIGRVRNAWFCSQSFPIPHGSIPAIELSNHTLLMQSQQSSAGVFLGKWMQQHAVFGKEVFSCDSLVALGGLAASGLGLAVLPRAVSAPLVQAGVLREINVKPRLDPVPYSIITKAGTQQPSMHGIIAIARSVCDFETARAMTPAASQA